MSDHPAFTEAAGNRIGHVILLLATYEENGDFSFIALF